MVELYITITRIVKNINASSKICIVENGMFFVAGHTDVLAENVELYNY